VRLLTREALLSFRRAPLLSTLSITTIAFSLFTLGLFGLVAINLREALRGIEERVEIVAFVLRGTPAETITLATAQQEGETTYAAKIEPEELHLDWSQPAEQLHRVVRLGRAWTTVDGKRLLVLRADTVDSGPPPGVVDGVVVGAGDGRGLRLDEVQPEGRGRQPAKAWRNGLRGGGEIVLGT